MTRRSPGEGNVRQRADGRWEARLTYEDSDGTVRVESFYAKSKAAALDKLDDARDRVKVEAPVVDSDMTLADWIEVWISTSLEASPRKQSTRALYPRWPANT